MVGVITTTGYHKGVPNSKSTLNSCIALSKPILADISLFQYVIYETLSSVLDSFNVAKIGIKSESTNFFQENPGIFLFFKKFALSLQHSF